MGWAQATNAQGRKVGYGVSAKCDAPKCKERIDRGLAYVCGGMHDGGEHGCGKYFCPEHLGGRYVSLCAACEANEPPDPEDEEEERELQALTQESRKE